MNPWMHAIGWTLIHFVWQGGLLALATAAGLRLCRRRSSEARYAIACAGLTALLAAPVVTAAFFWTPGSGLVRAENTGPAVPASDATLTVPHSSTAGGSSSMSAAASVMRIRLDAWLSFVVWGWLAGVTALLARFAGGCWRVHRLRECHARLPIPLREVRPYVRENRASRRTCLFPSELPELRQPVRAARAGPVRGSDPAQELSPNNNPWRVCAPPPWCGGARRAGVV